MKLNVGCGFNQLDGYLNVDAFADCRPDLIWNLERTPWPFPDDSIEEIVAHHVLEHLGQSTEAFFGIVKEIYRVMQHDGTVFVTVPYPTHPTFFTDPTHVRAYTADTFAMLSRAKNLDWSARGVNMTMLALMLDVNFDTVEAVHSYDEPWRSRLARRELTIGQVREAAKMQLGVIRELKVRLRVDKSHHRDADA